MAGQQTILYGIQKGAIRKLKQFSSSHHAPTEYNASARAFIEKVGQSEVEALARQILDEQRQLHALKRLDFSIDIQTGRVSVETPQLSFFVSISLDPEQLKQYRLRVEITAFKSITALEDSTLLDSLSPYCHSLSITSSKAIDVPAVIDAIEAIEDLRPILSYPNDASECHLRFDSLNLKLCIADCGLEMESILPKGLTDLIEQSEQALSAFNQSNPGVHFTLFAESGS